jgi:UDP-glucose 4-epimerase
MAEVAIGGHRGSLHQPYSLDMNAWGSLRGERVVVTGGAGFIGSNLVASLVEVGADVVVVDDFFTGCRDALPDIEIIEGSVADLDLMRRVCAGAHTVIHAATRNIIVSTANPLDDYKVNIGGTLNVLLAARDCDVSRVVYTSSCSVYGNKERIPISEDDPVSLLTPYAASKFAGEAYCQAFHSSYGLATTVVRYSNVYGPGQRPENPYCGVVSRFLSASLAGAPMRIHGSGGQTRDYTFIGDIVAATLMAAVSPEAEGNVYNIATEQETSVNELAGILGGEVEHVGLRDIDNVSRRALSIEKIRRELGWAPSVSLQLGLVATREWLLRRTVA